MSNWLYTQDGTAYRFEHQIVRVKNDEALEKLFQGRLKASAGLAEYLRDRYREAFQEELNITAVSLAVELYLHYKAQVMLLYLQKIFKKSRLISRLLRSTNVIDCGERSCDSNRFVWDILSHFVRKEKLFSK